MIFQCLAAAPAVSLAAEAGEEVVNEEQEDQELGALHPGWQRSGRRRRRRLPVQKSDCDRAVVKRPGVDCVQVRIHVFGAPVAPKFWVTRRAVRVRASSDAASRGVHDHLAGDPERAV